MRQVTDSEVAGGRFPQELTKDFNGRHIYSFVEMSKEKSSLLYAKHAWSIK